MPVDIEPHVLSKRLISSLERYLMVDFKNREFVELRSHNFAVVTFLKCKMSTMMMASWNSGVL